MYCEFCGKRFYTEYWDGGYIDHYENFAKPERHKWMNNDKEYAFEEVAKDGNDYRSVYDIEERLNCFLNWPDIDNDIKEYVKRKCDFLIDKMKKAKVKAENIVSGLTMIERKFLVREAQMNLSEPFGDEDGELFEGFEEE